MQYGTLYENEYHFQLEHVLTLVTDRQQHAATLDKSAQRGAPRLNAHARAVLAELRAAGCHPTATDLFATVRAQHPRIGLATVYRALARLEAAGLAVEVARDAQGRHYDARTDPHDHAACTVCGGLIDVERPAISLPDAYLAAARAHGHEVRGFEIRYYGRCAACRTASAGMNTEASGGAQAAGSRSMNAHE